MLLFALCLQVWDCVIDVQVVHTLQQWSATNTWIQGHGLTDFKSYLNVHGHMHLLLALVTCYSYHLPIHSDNDAAKYTYRWPTTAVNYWPRGIASEQHQNPLLQQPDTSTGATANKLAWIWKYKQAADAQKQCPLGLQTSS